MRYSLLSESCRIYGEDGYRFVKKTNVCIGVHGRKKPASKLQGKEAINEGREKIARYFCFFAKNAVYF